MRKWWPLVAVCLGTFMLLVDVTIVTVALPDMAKGLKASFSSLQWVMDVYALVLAALLLGVGSLADRVGRRKVYVAGLVVFAGSSLACGLAPSAGTLVAARAVQGAGAAAMFATTMALLNSTYQGRDRGVAFGVWGAVNGAAAAAGPIAGGLLTQHLGWRWIFLVNLPISVVAVTMSLRMLPESRNPAARRIDLPGMVCFTAAVGAVTYALIRGGDVGWTSISTLGTLAAAAAALLVFIGVQARSPHAMLDLRLFGGASFSGVMVAAFLLSVAAFSYLAYLSLWLQSVLGLSAIKAGLVIVPMSALSFLISALGGRFLHGVSPRWTVGIGLLLIGSGVLGQAMLTTGSGWTTVMPGIAVTGLGVGLAIPSLTAAAMGSVPPQRGGMAAGAVTTFRQLGYAIGIAVLGSAFRAGLERSLSGRMPHASAVASALSAAQAPAVIAGTPGGRRELVEHLVREAFVSGLNLTCVMAGTTGVAAGLLVLALVRRPVPAAPAPTRPNPQMMSTPLGAAVHR